METRILDGKKIAEQIETELCAEIGELRSKGIVPGLAVVLVGDNPASQLYVRSKAKKCRELGMHSESHELPTATTTDQLLGLVQELNAKDEIDGILVQLPLPSHIDSDLVLKTIDPVKDVDGFHPVNVGLLAIGRFTLAPCTPMGILEMLKREGIKLKGAEAVVVGRSNIVGKPMALLLLHQHATVTICHSRTEDLSAVCRRADILVAAIGRPAMITKEYIKPGATVVDVGTNKILDRESALRLFGANSPKFKAFERQGSVLVGDVHPTDPLGLAAAVTPVPGGVGPLTIIHLMKNALLACRARRGL
ncbi:MAG TPA: bifunctional 5,10-methylenetetrahydrofolate dehydrogenase/5,10-methenyltetrahydrofolate cyclohydrolase [Acidobacteriota bacterium]|nr:bifunctional 5,10-methylenetetrahydrofolate dehydrogenase/5,10-methenyltetrahydrofolate cyclohydrolase [Acidobacteriota bacterium]